MASGVEELLDMLFEMIDEAKNAPLSSDKCVIERDRALDLIDDIRSQFPMELGEARKVMASRAETLAAAKREADTIRKAAEDKARQLLEENTISLQARQRANELMQQVEERSRELRQAANAAKALSVHLTEPMGMDSAQVTAGGILTSEFDETTMESRLVPGLYACGEVLDIDGDCGGYNLQWAWSSGRLAGQLLTGRERHASHS